MPTTDHGPRATDHDARLTFLDGLAGLLITLSSPWALPMAAPWVYTQTNQNSERVSQQKPFRAGFNYVRNNKSSKSEDKRHSKAKE